MEENIEVLDAQKNQDEVVINEEETLSPQEIADLKHKAEVSSQNFERAKKAEEAKKALEAKIAEYEKSDKKPAQGSFSQKDVIALVRADVHDDDMETVEKFAIAYNLQVADALKNEDLKAVLERRAEKRKSAENTNTGPTKKATPKLSDQDILNKASKGEIPDKGSDDAERLFWARRGGKR